MNTDTYILTDFDNSDPEWFIVNDGVMGGLSQSKMNIKKGVAVFSGNVSLENNGGFASTRMRVKDIPADFKHIVLEVKGDGKVYQLRLRKDGNVDGIAYDYPFEPAAQKWESVRIPLSEVIGTFRGRRFSDMEGLLSEEIGQIGILIGNKQEGKFQLEIKSIQLEK